MQLEIYLQVILAVREVLEVQMVLEVHRYPGVLLVPTNKNIITINPRAHAFVLSKGYYKRTAVDKYTNLFFTKI